MKSGVNHVLINSCCVLAGTGKTAGNRHPQVENNVLIGAGASVLGNISIGNGAQVAAGSLVLQDVPRRSMVAGSPAYVIGKVKGLCAVYFMSDGLNKVNRLTSLRFGVTKA